MSKREDIRAVVAALSHRPVGEVLTTSQLTEDLGLRSLKRVELAVLLEDKLGVSVTDQKVMCARTVGDIEKLLGA